MNSSYHELRNIGAMNGPNDGTRSVQNSILAPQVIEVLKDWRKGATSPPLLIGTLAYSFWQRPRYTTDIDILSVDESLPIYKIGFRRVNNVQWEHLKTGLIVNLWSRFHGREYYAPVFRQVKKTSVKKHPYRVASVHGLIALKMYTFTRQDQADIEKLLELNPGFKPEEWTMPEGSIERLKEFGVKSLVAPC